MNALWLLPVGAGALFLLRKLTGGMVAAAPRRFEVGGRRYVEAFGDTGPGGLAVSVFQDSSPPLLLFTYFKLPDGERSLGPRNSAFAPASTIDQALRDMGFTR